VDNEANFGSGASHRISKTECKNSVYVNKYISLR